ncbi:elongation factor TFIIS domain 2-containing protein [Saitoella complicata NRRL Y-17804]|nr:elongation factor TFIIS domain 2-containing protein [Saitoella complicata NRRL Y-17804]ODQ53791.1 elongation factor TFIIS domain 2-containing protein [Saitoella complicata NRRL Y-17804]
MPPTKPRSPLDPKPLRPRRRSSTSNPPFVPTKPTKPMTDESLRQKSVQTLAQAITSNAPAPGDDHLRIAQDVEEAIFQAHGSATGNDYREAVRSRILNLKDPKNPDLASRLTSSAITPQTFATMSIQEMASPALKHEIEEIRDENMRQAVEVEEKQPIQVDEDMPPGEGGADVGRTGQMGLEFDQPGSASA